MIDRQQAADGMSGIERCLVSFLDNIGDTAQYVEYWWRSEWLDFEAHRDVAESEFEVGRPMRTPTTGHVLYLKVGEECAGPTCVFEQGQEGQPPGVDARDVAGHAVAGWRAVSHVTVVPAVMGRVLRFEGDQLHAVPRPAPTWYNTVELEEGEAELYNVGGGEDEEKDEDDEEVEVTERPRLLRGFLIKRARFGRCCLIYTFMP